ncbi:MAG: hypothetical protein HYX90_08325, partial [Chloroflexi bacterium]|nr:hypothetical protein [Chloroflexota bacterium]
MRRLSKPLKLHIGAITALGAAVLVLCVVVRPLGASTLTVPLAAAFAVLIGLAGVYPLPVSAKIKANVVTAPAFAAVLLLSPALAVLAAVAGVAASELIQKRRWPYVLFNTATAAMYAGGSALTYAFLNPAQGLLSFPSGVLTAAA